MINENTIYFRKMMNFLKLENEITLNESETNIFEIDEVGKIMIYNTKFPNGRNFYSINSSFPTAEKFVNNEVTRAIKLVSLGQEEDSAEPWASPYRTYIIEKYLSDDKIVNAIKSGSKEEKNKIKQKLIDIISKGAKRIPEENKFFDSKKQAEDWLYDNIEGITADQIISRGRKRLSANSASGGNKIKKIQLKKSDILKTKTGDIYVNTLVLQKDKELGKELKSVIFPKSTINFPLGHPKAGNYIKVDSNKVEIL